MSNITNRRRAERIELLDPLEAIFLGTLVLVAEIGLLGARLEHTLRLPAETEGMLEFSWASERLSFLCRVARIETLATVHGATRYRTGVEILHGEGESGRLLRELIALQVTRVLNEQKANARGERTIFDDGITPFVNSFSLDPAEQRRSAPRFQTFRLDAEGRWRSFTTVSTQQPADGFTVPETTSIEQIEVLKRSFESSDLPGRAMIRAMAELSVTEDNRTVPPARLK